MMAIRVEFFAEDQVIASSVVEFALSRGAILQAYSEINAPLERAAPKASKVLRRTKNKRPSMNRTVQCVNSDLPFRKGTEHYKAGKIIVKFNEPTPITDIYAAVKKAGIDVGNAYPALRKLINIGHVILVSRDE